MLFLQEFLRDYFAEMILKLFGGPKVSFDSLIKDVDVPDPAVTEYFRQEAEKLKRQNKLAASVSFSKCAFYFSDSPFIFSSYTRKSCLHTIS